MRVVIEKSEKSVENGRHRVRLLSMEQYWVAGGSSGIRYTLGILGGKSDGMHIILNIEDVKKDIESLEKISGVLYQCLTHQGTCDPTRLVGVIFTVVVMRLEEENAEPALMIIPD